MTDCCNLFCFFILTKHFCKSSNTCGSSAHFANIWHTDKTEVVTVPFEKKTPFKWLLRFTLFETLKKLWLAWVISHLCHEHNSSGFRVLVSSRTFGHKSCICSTIDSCRLFLHRVSSHHYLYHRQNMGPRYSSSRRREPVGEVRIKLCASLTLQSASYFANQWQVLKDPRDHARARKQRRLHLALIFECTFHRLIARVLSCFFSQLFCLI